MESQKDILNIHRSQGQSRHERWMPALDPASAPLDNRSTKELFGNIQQLAARIRYYDTDNRNIADATWASFFAMSPDAFDAAIADPDGNLEPHVALMAAFLKLYAYPQATLNGIVGRHLDFYYREVLRLFKETAVPDKAHVLFELKKGINTMILPAGTRLLGGKDAGGKDILFRTQAEQVINAARVTSLRSLYLSPGDQGALYASAVADSTDGAGTPLPDAVAWPAFGGTDRGLAAVGFAIGSDHLLLAEGERKITINITTRFYQSLKAYADATDCSLEVYWTGEKGWVGPKSCNMEVSGNGNIRLELSLTADDGAVVPHSRALHQTDFATEQPMLQFLLPKDHAVAYKSFAAARVSNIQVQVSVTGIQKGLVAENNTGKINPARPFYPYGPEPRNGDTLFIGSPEAMQKNLQSVVLQVKWKTAFSSSRYYATVAMAGKSNKAVDLFPADHTIDLVGSTTAAAQHKLLYYNTALFVRQLSLMRTGRTGRIVLRRRVAFRRHTSNPVLLPGMISLKLQQDFGHAAYRNALLAGMKNKDNLPTTIPVAPEMESASLNYTADTGVIAVDEATETAFASDGLQFFLVHPFGQQREHAYLRSLYDFIQNEQVSLMPEVRNEGELYIGIANTVARDIVHLLVQVKVGSSDPDLSRKDPVWSVLCDNYWKDLAPAELLGDTTNHLLKSGIVSLQLPPETSSQNDVLDSGLVWLRLSVPDETNGICRLYRIAANAVEVVRIMNGTTDPVLPAGKISKLLDPLAPVKGVTQPYPSFGGAAEEDNQQFYTRVSERLRHKNRAVSRWDYERMILAAFPAVSKVKCLNHSSPAGYLSPGNVTLVLLPDLEHTDSAYLLEPRVDKGTCEEIRAYVQERAGGQLTVHIRNPRYEKVEISCKVQMRPGYDYNTYAQELNIALLKLLTPWAFNNQQLPRFAGSIYKSVIINYMEDLPYVDYVTEVKMFHWVGGIRLTEDKQMITATVPDAILTTSTTHQISPVQK